MRFRTWLVAILLAGSGFCALVYQVAWLREFRLIFGASTAASAAVLAIFIGGLGAGGLLLGPRVDRQPRPLLFYAALEAIVAISAAASPLLLSLVRSLYLASGGSMQLGALVATVGRLVLTALVLAIPTLAMGATLPAAARAATRETDERRQDVAALYALNTLGAVAGCLTATFWMLETFGTHRTIWIAAAVNLLVAGLAFAVDRFMLPDVPLNLDATTVEPPATSHQTLATSPQSRAPSPQHQPSPAAGHQGFGQAGPAPVWFLLASSATVGFAFFLMELIWYRLLGPLLGGSVFTFGLILAVALAGVGLGGLLYALVSSDKPATLAGLATVSLLEGLAVAATYALGDRVALFAAVLLPLEGTGFDQRILGWTAITTLVVLPVALAAGYQFPLIIALLGRARTAVGREIGLAYAANTAGAIVGSLAGGFGLLPWLSAVGAWQLVANTLAILGAVAAYKATSNLRSPRLVVHAALALATVGLTLATGPTAVWRQSGIGAGRIASAQMFASPNQFRQWMAEQRRGIVWDADGVESGVALTLDPFGYAFMINGKSDGSARSDAGTQVMLGLLGALAVPAPRNALVIGLGTGSTAGWLGAIPSIERVDTVELEPLVVEIARACSLVNRDVLNNPKVHIIIGDAREVLLTTRNRYDVIASEPSNPYRAGIASLFTVEYYRAAADRLSDDGVFVQWIQAYEIDATTLRTIYATLAAVFPQVETWYTNPGDIALVASKRPHTYRAADLTRRIAEEPYRAALSQTWRSLDIQGLLAHYLANQSMTRAAAETPGVQINTDDRNVVEFGLARSVGVTLTTVTDIRDASIGSGTSRPPLDDETAVRWAELDTAWMSYNAATGAIDPRTAGPQNEQARQAALIEYYQNQNIAGARQIWSQQPDQARDPTEMAMLADIAATSGQEAGMYFIDRLRAFQPNEAHVMMATLRLQQSRFAEAADAVDAAFTGFRTDPWAQSRYIDRGLQVASILSQRDTGLAQRMFAALGSAFAVKANEDNRLATRAMMSKQGDFAGRCVAALAPLEPYFPWAEPLLRLRNDCYQATNHALSREAYRDLAAFIANAPRPLIPSAPSGVR